jgi:putative ABC transport system substrate-binding protein
MPKSSGLFYNSSEVKFQVQRVKIVKGSPPAGPTVVEALITASSEVVQAAQSGRQGGFILNTTR